MMLFAAEESFMDHPTVLGWTIVGTSSHQLPTTAETLLVQTPTLDDELFHQVQNWMRLDNEGVSSTKKAFSANDRRAEKILQSTTTKIGDRYQIGLLWKPNVDLPNNRWVAERQLRTLEQRLQKDPTLKEQYKKTIDDDLAKGYIVEVPTVDATLKKWYLPHHPVTNVNKPGKVRRVTNASSVFKGQSLNNNLLTGPDFLCNLTGLIMRFRQHSVAISADIEAMFMQVLVDAKDRQYLHFLWSNDTKTIEFEYTRHIFGATDSPCVACYAVRKCAKDNEAVYPGLPAIVQRNIYMYDLYVSLTSEEDATDTARKLREVLATGGFNLTKWSSNSRNFLAGVSPEQRATGSNPDDKLTLQLVLGLPWDPEKDTYLIQPESYRRSQGHSITNSTQSAEIYFFYIRSLRHHSTVNHSIAMYYAACLEHRTTMGQTYCRRSTCRIPTVDRGNRPSREYSTTSTAA